MKLFLLFIIIYIYLFNYSSSNSNDTNQDNNLDINEDQEIPYNQENQDNQIEDENAFNFNPIFKEFNEEWDRTMQTFVSQYMYSIQVKYKTEVEYYENITKTPCLFRGTFFIELAETENDVLDFKIVAPNKTVIFEKTSFAAIFSLNLTDTGLYTIIFRNRVLKKDIRPTLMINSGQNLILQKENLSETEKKLDSIITFLKKFEQDTKLSRGFKRKGNEALSRTNRYFFIFSLIETIILVSVSIWQYCYLKHLFEVKGSL